MSNFKCAPTPFQLSVKLTVECTTPLAEATLYRQLVSSLIYLTHSRPDLSFAVRMVSQIMQQPYKNHWHVTKRILRYLKETLHYRVFYSSSSIVLLSGYIDFNWVGDSSDRWSTASYIFQLRSGLVSSSNKKIKTISLSSCEAEYRGAKEAVSLQHVLIELGLVSKSSTMLKCDNQDVIQLYYNQVYHSKTKHINFEAHYI